MLFSQLWRVPGSRFPPRCRCPLHWSGNHPSGRERLVNCQGGSGGIGPSKRQAVYQVQKTEQIKKHFKALFLKDFYNTCGSHIKYGKIGQTEKQNSNMFHYELTCWELGLTTKHHSPIETVWMQLEWKEIFYPQKRSWFEQALSKAHDFFILKTNRSPTSP